MSDDFKKKAVDINVESLKLYITLSTVSIAGLLTYYSKLTDPINSNVFYWSILLFLLCAVDSIIIVNHFIIQANNDAYNVRTPLSRIANFIAIFLFIGAVITGGLFITKNSGKKQETTTIKSPGLTIENNKIYISSDVKMKIIIETDTLKNIGKIYINCDK